MNLINIFHTIFTLNIFLGYIDPGTGSVILQAIIAGIVGISLTVKIYWQRIKKLLKLKKTSENDTLNGKDIDIKE